MALVIRVCSPSDKEVKPLLAALSDELFRITGNDGRASFADDDMQAERSVFLVAMADGEAVGCGGLRPLTDGVCEIKRMYARYHGQGIGCEILRHLEQYAQEYGYKEIWLETRKVNENAVKFYLQQGYRVRDNYGKYIGRNEAVCFEKMVEETPKEA
ncbi:MAG TPA: GNAT family N-acetyltransferase [Anaerolineales bacterium]|nr:GNAT family N-acetyltransferase [Anaerolineales bacterium]